MRRIMMMVMAIVLVVAACGGDDDSGAGEDTADDAAAAGLSATTSDLGEILVDADGMTLYLFVPDDGGDSTCYDQCEDNWPPLYQDELGDVGAAIDAALLGTTERTDGTVQVTYNGWPLYRFAADNAAGDTNGQGVNDVWWVVSPGGEAIES